MERFWRRGDPAELAYCSVLQDHDLGKFAVYVQTDQAQGDPPSL